MAKYGLGKGLGALLGEDALEISQQSESVQQGAVHEVDILKLDRFLEQPRKTFDDDKLSELAESIRIHGIIQPIVVREQDGRFTIVAGERRFRAARKAGLKTVPIVVKNIDDKEHIELALIENIQREDLNAIEQATAIKMLMTEHNMTQEQVADRIGKSRSAVANTLRLLTLSPKVAEYVRSNQLSAGHARCLTVFDHQTQDDIADNIIKKDMSVREVEALIASLNAPRKPKKVPEMDEDVKTAERVMTGSLGTKVRIAGNRQKGKVIIEYYSEDQLNTLYDLFTK